MRFHTPYDTPWIYSAHGYICNPSKRMPALLCYSSAIWIECSVVGFSHCESWDMICSRSRWVFINVYSGIMIVEMQGPSNLTISHCKYYDGWCPVQARGEAISSHGIGLHSSECYGLSNRSIGILTSTGPYSDNASLSEYTERLPWMRCYGRDSRTELTMAYFTDTYMCHTTSVS